MQTMQTLWWHSLVQTIQIAILEILQYVTFAGIVTHCHFLVVFFPEKTIHHVHVLEYIWFPWLVQIILVDIAHLANIGHSQVNQQMTQLVMSQCIAHDKQNRKHQSK